MSRSRPTVRLVATLAGLALAGIAVLQAQARHPVSGRVIAGVMGHEGASWLERPERVREENPERALDALDIPRGAIVADVGAGSGYYTVRLATRVGPGGRVYATDIQREMLAMIDRRLRRDGIRNVELVLGTEDDPKLPARTFDVILMVDVYHELARPQAMLQRMRAALKPEGRLVLIEFRKEDQTVPIRYEHKMSEAEARQELEAEGFAFERNIAVLPWQHILVFRPAPPAARGAMLRGHATPREAKARS